MRNGSKILACSTAFILALFAGTANAAPISWGSATNICTGTDVSTSGLLIEAINNSKSALVPGCVTVNTVTFTNNATLLSNNSSADMWSGTTGDACYDQLVSDFDFGSGCGVTTISLGGGSLVSGNLYQIQIWFTDDRPPQACRVMEYGDGWGGGIGANTVNLKASASGSNGTPGQYAFGAFTADGTCQTFTLRPQGFCNSHFNAYQIRQITHLFWDMDNGVAGAAPGGGCTAAGTWDACATNWSMNSDGSACNGGWVAGLHAVFAAGCDATGTYAITVDGTQQANGLSFEEGNVTLQNGTNGVIDFTTIAADINVACGLIATLDLEIAGSAGITKTGAGTIVISGSNTYTGDTNISNGILMLGADNVIPDTSDVVLNGGTFDTNGYDDTAGNLTLDTTSTINLAGGNSIINFSTMNNNAGTLSVWNWDGIAGTTGGNDQLIFNTNFGAGPFANIDFYNDDGNTFIGKGILVNIGGSFWELLPVGGAVPETSTWISAGGLLALAAWHFRRRKRIPMLSPPS